MRLLEPKYLEEDDPVTTCFENILGFSSFFFFFFFLKKKKKKKRLKKKKIFKKFLVSNVFFFFFFFAIQPIQFKVHQYKR